MKSPLARALITLAIAILLAATAPHSAQVAKALTSPLAGVSLLSDPSDVPWGG
jgi:ABC-type uncharacterized transport system substrate-binding protein